MPFRNDQGTPVDPVPFLVVGLSAFLVCFSFGPLYLDALGVDLTAGVATSGAVFLATTAVAYHRLVRRARPTMRAEVPPENRLRRLLYATLALTCLLGLLAIPLLR